MSMPNIGLQIPVHWWDRVPDTQQLRSFFQRAEELGFHSLWVTERPLHRISIPDPLTLLTFAAACTTRIQLGTAVLLLSLRNAVELARTAATLDVLAGGRLTIGVSLGGHDDEHVAMNAPKRQRVGRLEEGITVLRKLWTETDVTFHGRYYHLERANVAPKPSRPGGIPIAIGTGSELGLQRTGRMGDGWLAGGPNTPERFARCWQAVQEAAREAGRDPSKLFNQTALYCSVDADRELARRELQTRLDAYYGPGHEINETTPFGTPRDLVPMVHAFADAGCQTVCLGLPRPDVAKLEWIAEELAPLMS